MSKCKYEGGGVEEREQAIRKRTAGRVYIERREIGEGMRLEGVRKMQIRGEEE